MCSSAHMSISVWILRAFPVWSWTEDLASCPELQSVCFVNPVCREKRSHHTFQKQLRKKVDYPETLHRLAHVPFNMEHRGNTWETPVSYDDSRDAIDSC